MAMLQLQPDQIAVFWDSIKVTMLASNDVREDVQEAYLNNILEKLLSGKLVCWIIYDYVGEDNDKQIYAMAMSSIREDLFYGYTYLVAEGLFGFRKMSNEQAKEAFKLIKKYAQNVGCKAIMGLSDNPKAIRLMELANYKPVGQVYRLEV